MNYKVPNGCADNPHDQEFLDLYWDATLSYAEGKIGRREFGQRMKALGHFPSETQCFVNAIEKHRKARTPL